MHIDHTEKNNASNMMCASYFMTNSAEVLFGKKVALCIRRCVIKSIEK